VKTTAPLFEIGDPVTTRPFQRVAPVVAEATEDDVTGVARIALFGELLDHLGLVESADRRSLRPIGPGGYTGGECYRPIVELQLAGGDFLSDVSLLQDEATKRLRGSHALPSHTTLYRFVAGADLGRVQRAAAVNRDMLRRAWAMGAAPLPGRLTIDPDATYDAPIVVKPREMSSRLQMSCGLASTARSAERGPCRARLPARAGRSG
jgi:hypothetical protein